MRNQDNKNTNDPQKKYRLGTVSKNVFLEGLNQFHGANLVLNTDVDQDTFGEQSKATYFVSEINVGINYAIIANFTKKLRANQSNEYYKSLPQ